MGAIKAEILNIRDEIEQTKIEIEKYRSVLRWSFYGGGGLLLLVLWWIFFPPEQAFWILISNSCFLLLLINLWISYWSINKIKSSQSMISELWIKITPMFWEKVCDCKGVCDCKDKMESEFNKEDISWSDGVLAEVKHESGLS